MKQISNLLRLNIKPLLLMLFLIAPMFIVEAKKQKYDNGDYYEGGWSKGMPKGTGIMTYANGDVYEGEWVNGERSNSGKMSYHNGDVYEGNWSRDEENGKGVMTYANGDVYSGDWVFGLRNGECIMRYFNKDNYVGSWSKDAPNGTGKMTYANGDVYEGNWEWGVIKGKGSKTYSNGDKYEGMWLENKRSSSGSLQYANGDKYNGAWSDDKKNGQAVLTLSNGGEYRGVWQGDELTSGGYYESDKLLKEGEWKDYKLWRGDEIIDVAAPGSVKRVAKFYKDGKYVDQTIYYTNGSQYIGAVNKYNREGDGTFYYGVGDKFKTELSGVWSNDKLVKGVGVIKGGELGDKFEIQSAEDSKFKVTVFDNEKIIYSEVLSLSLNEIISQTIYNIKSTIEDRDRKVYYDKNLKNKVFISHAVLNEDTFDFKLANAFFNLSSLSVFESVVFDDHNNFSFKRVVYIDKGRAGRIGIEMQLMLLSMAQQLSTEESGSFTMDGDYIITEKHKFKCIPSENILFDEDSNITLKFTSDAETKRELAAFKQNSLF